MKIYLLYHNDKTIIKAFYRIYNLNTLGLKYFKYKELKEESRKMMITKTTSTPLPFPHVSYLPVPPQKTFIFYCLVIVPL